MTNPNHRVCSRVNYTTQVAFWVNDEQNMLPFYTRGLGMKKVATLSFADLAKTMEHAGNLTDEQLRGLRMMGNKPWIDYIEVAPHQYIELFYSAQKTLEESQDLQFSYGFQHICIEVSDIQESWKAVTANGITPDTEINLGADGAYQFWITDPDGNRLEFMEYGPDALQRKEV
jgi:lactoylglutathione lyase